MLKTRNFYRVISGAFFALCMVFGSASAWAVDCDAGYYLPANKSTCKPCPAGKYCNAGSYSTGTSDQGIKGNVNAGYFATCGATKAAPNATVGGVAGDDSNGCLSGCTCGKINIGYYSNGGTKKASPSAGDCISGKTCGKCLSGFTTASGGQTTPTACYQTQTAGVSCNTVFPYSKMNSGATVTYNGSSSTLTSTRRYQTSATTVGEWQTGDTSGSCVVTNFSCSSSPDSFTGSSLQIGTVKAYSSGSPSGFGYNQYNLGTNQVMVDYTIFKVYGQTISSSSGITQYQTQSSKPTVDSSGAHCWLRIIAVESSSGEVYTSYSIPWIYMGQIVAGSCAYATMQQLQTNTTLHNYIKNYTYYSCSKSSVTCAAGKYLAKEATSCSNCPAGQYCEGGTFKPGNSARGITGYVSAGYYSTGSASSPTPNLIGAGYYGDVGATASTGTGVVAAGYYSSNGGTSSTPDSNGSGCVGTGSCGKVIAGFYSTGGAKSSAPMGSCVSGYSCGTIDAGYWGEEGATSSTGSGAVAAGYYSTGAGTSATGDCMTGLGTCGLVSANYYSSGGAKNSTPSSTDCVGSNTCGACMSGYSSPSGSSSYTACTMTVANGKQCSSIFPVTVGWPWTNVVYTSDDNPQFTQNYAPNSANAHTTSDCTYRQTGVSNGGVCLADNPDNCFVRGVSCATDFHLWTRAANGTSEEQQWNGGNSAGVQGTPHWDESIARPGIGTFDVSFGNGYSVHGIWMKANLSTGYHYNENGVMCVCQIQAIGKSDGKTYPVTSTWADASGSGHCYDNCIDLFNNSSAITSKFTIYPFRCLPDSLVVTLDGNSAGAGTIANQSATAGHPVAAKCTSGNSIGTGTITWNKTASNNNTNITKTVSGSSKIFVGWGENANDTTPTSLTCSTGNLVNETEGTYKTYYAVWKDPSCTKPTGASTATVSAVSENKITCSVSNSAGYYCAASQTGSTSVTPVTPTCGQCKSNWTSTAGAATTEANCTRNIVLDKNGGSGTITVGSINHTGTSTGLKTCNYNTACSFPATTNLSQTGYSFTGKWSTSSSCSDGGSTAPTITSTASTVTYYACKTANNITITWTGVSSIPSSGFTTISNDTTTSTVAYNGNIATPSGAIVAAAGQTFLGWKFSN